MFDVLEKPLHFGLKNTLGKLRCKAVNWLSVSTSVRALGNASFPIKELSLGSLSEIVGFTNYVYYDKFIKINFYAFYP